MLETWFMPTVLAPKVLVIDCMSFERHSVLSICNRMDVSLIASNVKLRQGIRRK